MTVFSTLNPYMTYIKLGGMAVLMAGSAWGGYELGHLGLVKEKLAESQATVKAVSHAASTDRASAGLSGAVRDHLDTEQAKTRTITQTILKEVPVYVPEKAADTGVTVGFALLHNYAASGYMPPASPAPGLALDSSAGIGMPALSGVITRNYGVCHAWKSEALAWRDAYGKWEVLWTDSAKAH